MIQTTSEIDILDDGYYLREYEQKVVKGNLFSLKAQWMAAEMRASSRHPAAEERIPDEEGQGCSDGGGGSRGRDRGLRSRLESVGQMAPTTMTVGDGGAEGSGRG